MENANDFIILDPILVVGGYDGDDKIDTVELLSIKYGTGSKRLETFPKKISYAVGTTLGEWVIHIFLTHDTDVIFHTRLS